MVRGVDKLKAMRVRRDTAGSLEISRIIRLPIVPELLPEEVDAFSEQEIQARYSESGFRLFPTQAAAVLAYDIYGGLFAPIGVGWGKTLITLMIADRALQKGIDRTMLFVPPQVYQQLTLTDIPWARKRVGLRTPFILLGGKSRDERRRIVGSKKKGCYVLPYSLLSTTDTNDLLNGVCPGLIVLDEAHNVKNPKAARTKRLFGPDGFITRNQPEVCSLSGTITNKSLRDYGHLISYALRDQSPLPMDSALIDQWARALDANADQQDQEKAQTGPMRPLLQWFQTHWADEKLPPQIAGYRKAFNRRLITCPGVTTSGDAEIGVALSLENDPVKDYQKCKGFDVLLQHMKDVEELWITPSGDEIDEGFQKWRYLYELTAGFYHRQRWPDVEELLTRARFKDLSVPEVEAYLEQAQECHELENKYRSSVRKWIEYEGKPGLDTPFLVGGSMYAHGSRDVGARLYQKWTDYRDLQFEGMPERLSEPILVCDYKIKHAAQWALKYKRGIIWYENNAIGMMCAEACAEAGLDVIWCPAESRRKGMNQVVQDPRNKDKILVCAMGGHGTGKNMQHFQNTYFLQFPRKAPLVQQVIGRTHRNGQMADELVVHTNNTLDFDAQNASACIIDALYQHQTMGARQKIIFATYNPLPKIYPDDFLRERGFKDVKQLSQDARTALEEKFGTLQGD